MASTDLVDDENDLETLLAKATNPLYRHPEPESLAAFCDLVEKEHDGPQTALRLLAHKIQSPQEKESLLALAVLEESVKNCGAKFRSEVGKFRFLNEMIKTVSPKYLGNRTSFRVKKKIVELMFLWSMELKHETKIFEAYQMLKRQGVVTEDPVHVLQNYEPPPPPPPRAKNAIFEDEEKAQQLQKLLRSRNPEDLQAANRLIKNMVREADRRMEILAKRSTELETVHNNAKVLADMLIHYKPGETSHEEKDLMKELYDSCERLRPKLFRLAGEMDEKDEGLGDILKANDELTSVINNYKKAMSITTDSSNDVTATVSANCVKGEPSLLDLGSPVQERPPPQLGDSSLLDDQLLALGLNDPPPGDGKHVTSQSADTNSKEVSGSLADLDQIFSTSAPKVVSQTPPTVPILSTVPNAASSNSLITGTTAIGTSFASVVTSNVSSLNTLQPVLASSTSLNSQSNPQQKKPSSTPVSKALEELDALGQTLLKQSLPSGNIGKVEFPSTPQKIPLSQLKQQMTTPSVSATPQTAAIGEPSAPLTTSSIISRIAVNEGQSPSLSPAHEVLSLKDLFVPLETIQPGSLPPLTIHEKNGLTVVIHFGKNIPRSDVTVMVVSTMSKSSSPVKNVSFQAAVPKSMKIKLQPPSATDLPPHNPILPPAAITQVMLLANPQKETVRFKYKVNYTINDKDYTDIGEVDSLLSLR